MNQNNYFNNTNKKQLHIVFGFIGKAVLTQSGLIEDEHDEIISFDDPPSCGPLSDLEQEERIINRKLWLNKTLGHFETEDGVHLVDDTLNKLQTILDTINNYDRIQLWTGNVDNEKITAARLLYHLQKMSIPIFKVNFSRIAFENKIGRTVTPVALSLIDVAIAQKIDWHFEELSVQERQALVSLWEQLRNDDHLIHTFGKDGNLISADESYYDRYLLARTTNMPQKSSKIVCFALCDIWEDLGFECSVGDLFLFDRLNKLQEKGRIEITNRSEDADSEHRLFDVKKSV